MRTIEGDDRADFTFDVVCDHADDPACVAPERLVAVVYHVPRPAGTFGFLEWRAATVSHDGEQEPPAMETYWDVVRRLTDGMPEARRQAILRDPRERDRLVSRNGGQSMSSQSWNFKCSDCRMTVPARYGSITPRLETARANAVPRLLLRQLRAILQV